MHAYTRGWFYLESGCELRDQPDDLVVLDVVISVLHEISPENLHTAEPKTKTSPSKTKANGSSSVRDELQQCTETRLAFRGFDHS